MLSVFEAKTDLKQEESETDEAVTALAAHDSDAWNALFERYYRKMYNFAYVRTGDATAAEDIAAEVFIAAVKGISRYKRTGAPFAGWLYRIARNLTADHLDSRRRRPVVPLDAIELASGAWDRGVEDAVDIARVMALLTDEQQEVVLLRFFNDCSLAETAAAMNKSPGAIKLLQHRAIASMRRHMSGGGA